MISTPESTPPQSQDGYEPEKPAPPSGRGFLRALVWGDVFVSLALLAPALEYYQPAVRPYAVAGVVLSLAVEVLALRAIRSGAKRSDGLLLLLAVLFGFYAVHNFVAVGMMALRPSWLGVVFVLAGAFFAWATVGLLRLWAKR